MPNQKITMFSSNVLTVEECFDEYINHCNIKNLSTEMIKLYQHQFHIFQSMLDDDDRLISTISITDVNNFILYLRNKHSCNDITINSYLRGVRAFLYYAMSENHLQSFKLTIPKVEKKIKETYTDVSYVYTQFYMLNQHPRLTGSLLYDYKPLLPAST